ncbi:hypothetical protein [Tautonia plasticadhaerens]|uniref:hypothetical protein n=1 Tax=Tautonia plasticadhaerens TaxID=2527974 RepID=UPI0011A0059A|nr:hypothetical protein [Tautonia plasticadhaerens]
MLAIGLIWTAAIRVPLILLAADHLDSDLAVDGLTLLDAVEGRWRWHYPGTPHMGILPVLLSYPQAMIGGAGPIALVSGGTVAWLIVVASTFLLAWRAFGPSVACWAIVPLVFSSVGTVWLSGRITGGHLLTLAWHASAFLGMVACLSKGGSRRAGLLGLWCGLGLYLDAMFAFTLAGLVPAAVASWWSRGRSKAGILAALTFVIGLAIGAVPSEIGRRVDPHDPYNEQFSPVFQPEVLAEHARILALECLPRLIAGHELPSLRATPEDLSGTGRPLPARPGRVASHPHAVFTALLALGLFSASVARLAIAATRGADPGGRAVAGGLLGSAALIVAAFLVNRNIFNSDNYRYLIFLLVPWSVGFGLLMRTIAGREVLGRVAAPALAILLGASMTASVAGWYLGLGWVDGRLVPNRETPGGLRPDAWADLVIPVRAPGGRVVGQDWFRIPSEATHIYGDYWDVYRVAFLSGGRVVGVPLPTYPNRFEGWSAGLGPGRGSLVVLDPVPGWEAMLAESWRREGRDPAELDRITITTP